MKKYIGTKQVSAEPMTYGEAYVNGLIRDYASGNDDADGYKVVYADGYTSWSPKGAFEEAYHVCDGMTFGQAIEALKQGMHMARKGWNGKNMHLWLKPAATIKAEWCRDSQLKALAESNGGEIEALGTICMLTAQHQILSGWLASQTDMLSEDWIVVPE